MIRERLRKGEKCVLISTSLVELEWIWIFNPCTGSWQELIP